MIYLLIALAVLALVAGLTVLAVRGRRKHPGLAVLQGWKYAHRGLHGQGKPENSMAAFRAALEAGYGVELDVHLMKDGNLAVIHDASLKRTAGKDVKIEVIIPAFISVVLTIVGNYLPKCKQNSTMGIKIPWTLKSEENWNKTHHMAGYLWMISGIIGLIASLLGAPVVCLAIFAVMVIVPTVYSYRLHKKGI